MHFIRRYVCYPLSALGFLLLIAVGAGFLFWRQSLPALDGEALVKRLSAPVTVTSDQHGIPVITATNRNDALRALGYISARDRLFQMDLMRRKNAGQLAELFGDRALDNDIRARTLGFTQVAKAVLAKLPPLHRDYLEAYAEGVNSYIDKATALPFEFFVLNYRPAPWQAEDSLLVVLGMFDMLNGWAENEERMLSVMEKNLDADVLAFLTPDTDHFTDRLLTPENSFRPARPIPVAALQKALHQQNPQKPAQLAAVKLRDFIAGSNAFAVSGAKTQDGRAILANDMHLGISVPNLWYRAELRYGSVHAAGVTLPGVPLMVTGSTQYLAWGSTNLSGDFLDLVSLDINPDHADEYRVKNQWQRFAQRTETILVKNANPKQIQVKQSVWGPVATEPLLGKPVAIHWTALDANAVNLGLIDMEQAETLGQALTIVNRTGGPQLNVLLADQTGHIAWTIMGYLPKRIGGDGSVSRSWTDGSSGWDGYVQGQALPRQIDPADGILASANDRRLDKRYPYVIGHQFANGYRAYRITQRLKQLQISNEWALFNLQLDTENEFYAFYQQLALGLLSPAVIAHQPELRELRDYLLAWNGKADVDSLGFALLRQFRDTLADSLFTPFLASCRAADKNFEYAWTHVDTPLQALLTEKIPELLPDPKRFKNWDDFLLELLKQSTQQLQADYPNTPLPELTWGQTNQAQFAHPFAKALPLLGWLLNMPEDKLAGCSGCVRVTGHHFGASERLVVSPAHLDEGILHMPGGQSAHPLSPYYRDQQAYWVKGLAMPLLAESSEHSLTLKPVNE
jgi:penicillin amidase